MSRPTAVITGATSGIGRSFAWALAARGYDLFLTGRRREPLEALCARLAETHDIVAESRIIELTDRDAMLGLVEQVRRLEHVAVLINNAGFGRSSPFHDDEIEAENGMVTVHVETTLRLTHAVIPAMIERGVGRIINVSSLASYLPLPRGAVYASTKAWMRIFSESLALELAPYGIRCQALLPGFTRTDFHRDPQYGNLDRRNRGLIRWMEPDEVVRISLREIERGRRILCIPGLANRLLAMIQRATPRRVLYRIVAANRVLEDPTDE